MHRSRWTRILPFAVVAALATLLPATPALADPPEPYAASVPAVSAANGWVVVAAVDKYGPNLLYNYWPRSGKAPWMFPSGLATSHAPAVALVGGNYLFLLARADSTSRVYVNQLTLGGNPIGWSPLNVSTPYAPAADSAGNRTVAAVTAPDGRVLYDWWDLGGGAHGFRALPAGPTSVDRPAVAVVGNGTYMFVVIRGADNQLWLNQGNVGGGFVGWQPLGAYSSYPPALASEGNRTALAMTAFDGSVWYDWWDLGGGGHGLRSVHGGQYTDAGPAVSLNPGGAEVTVYARLRDSAGTSWMYFNRGPVGGSFGGWTNVNYL